jgi:hypothetical protein
MSGLWYMMNQSYMGNSPRQSQKRKAHQDPMSGSVWRGDVDTTYSETPPRHLNIVTINNLSVLALLRSAYLLIPLERFYALVSVVSCLSLAQVLSCKRVWAEAAESSHVPYALSVWQHSDTETTWRPRSAEEAEVMSLSNPIAAAGRHRRISEALFAWGYTPHRGLGLHNSMNVLDIVWAQEKGR